MKLNIEKWSKGSINKVVVLCRFKNRQLLIMKELNLIKLTQLF
jgi:hypothetical protein